MKTLTLSLAVAALAIAGCASTSSRSSLASTGGFSSSIGSSGALASRAGATIAEPIERSGRSTTGGSDFGIPTPQPARDNGMFAYPTPQPPIPDRVGSGIAGTSPYSRY